MNYKRESVIRDFIYEVNDLVKLPFDEIGKIVKINDKGFDFFKYKVVVLKGSFNERGEILPYKFDQLKELEYELKRVVYIFPPYQY